MADTTEKKPEVQAEAASPETVPEVDAGKPQTTVTHVWASAGGVAKSAVIRTAIQQVRDAIPVVYELDAEITGAKASTQDKQPGTSFEVTITYTPRETAGKKDPVDLDRVIRGLEVPRSLEGLSEHPGAADFLKGA